MTSSVTHTVKALSLAALGLAIAAMGFYVANADDAPGAAVMGFLLMVAAVVLGVKTARNRLPRWASRTALAVGLAVAAFASFLTHAVTVAAPLFPEPREVPSVSDPASAPPFAAAAERARALVRAAILEQNLPGVSVAVGTSLPAAAQATGAIVWAEGFGWRDVETETPVTPETRFHIGTAAAIVTPAAAVRYGLAATGADSAADWSPEHIGEPEEDFPLFRLVHDIILRPVGVTSPAQPLPGERATFYVPRSDNSPRLGRRLMYMRDLACCADGKAFSSTPSDLVRFALAADTGSFHGDLAGGRVVSLTRDSNGTVVAVASNIAYARTAALAEQVAAKFAAQK